MSLQWTDNYGWCGTGAGSLTYLLSGTPYSNLQNQTGFPGGVIADPVVGGQYCLQVGQSLTNYDNSDNALNLPVPANAVGMAKRWYASGGNQRSPMQWSDVGGNVLYRLVSEVNGALSIYGAGALGAGSTPLATTTIPVITFNTWWHIETMVDYALGAINVYVEGVPVLTYSFAPAGGTLVYVVGWSPRYGEGSPGGTILQKDFVVYDKSGTVNNVAGAIGPCTVYRLTLNTDVSNGWTITGGSTVSGTIGGEPPVDGSKYISAGTGPIPAGAICTINPLPTNIVGVRGIMSLQRVQKSDGGDANYQIDIKSGSSTHTGTTHPVSTSYNYQWDVVELDPATGALFSPIAVNNLNIEINRTV